MLTKQRMKLCEEYIRLNFSNQTEAARRAGYKDSPMLHSTASQVLNAPECQEYIQKRIRAMLTETDRMTIEWLNNVRRIMNADLRRLMEWNDGKIVLKPSDEISDDDAYAIAEISETVTEHGGSRKIKLESKTKALELLGKYLAILGDTPIDNPQTQAESLDAAARKERLAYLIGKMKKNAAN